MQISNTNRQLRLINTNKSVILSVDQAQHQRDTPEKLHP